MDITTSDVRSVEFTTNRAVDSLVLLDLLDEITEDEQTGSVTADGASDTRGCHVAITARKAEAIVPVCRNRLWKDDGTADRARNVILHASQRFGRSVWNRWSGYYARSRLEARK